MLSSSKDHLKSVDETYFQHMGFALKFACCCIKAGLMAIIHAFIPAFFQTSASKEIKCLAEKVAPDNRNL